MSDILIILVSGIFLFLWELWGGKLIDNFVKSEDTIILGFVVIIGIICALISWAYLIFTYIIF